MQRVIVTIRRQGSARDIDVPAGLPGSQLAEALAHALGWDRDRAETQAAFRIKVTPPGRALAPEETLADAGTWDGAILDLYLPGENMEATPKYVFIRLD